MPKALNLTGNIFGHLTALSKAESQNGHTYWNCQCDCGKIVKVQTTHLRNGTTKSCGHSKKGKENICINCGIITTNEKYCSNKCQQEYQRKQYIAKWQQGLETGMRGDYGISAHIVKYLFKKYQNQCSRCGWGELNSYTNNIPLEVEHIDGNYKNNKEENLTLLCPNCHSLTATYKGANKGNGRKERAKYNL